MTGSLTLFEFLVGVSIAATAVFSLILLYMILRDAINKTLW